MNAIEKCVVNFNGVPNNLVNLKELSPDNLGYSTIVSKKEEGNMYLGLVDSVYEWQSTPLMYMVDGSSSRPQSTDLNQLRRILALRGDSKYLGVAHPNKLDVYKIALDKKPLQETQVKFDKSAEGEKALFANLANFHQSSHISQTNWISQVILNLLTSSITKLVNLSELSNEDTISLVGRALFARFLDDRNLVPSHLKETENASDLFDDPQKALITSHWIDATFNGDFLPISDSTISGMSPKSCHELGNIMRKAPNEQLYLGWDDKEWKYLDFAHIPVGILSQVYEMYLNTHHPIQQIEQSGYYTPGIIANFMTDISIDAALANSLVKKPKILDPAAGAGVFLISAFQKLVKERWQKDGVRPNTKTLRSILNNQITGFDLNESALRFASLGLYLISIELDPNPNPVTKLKFNKLLGKVLYNFAGDRAKGESNLGSLSNLVGNEHIGKYDIVIGNPPWSSQKKSNDWPIVKKSIRQIIECKGNKYLTNPIPNNSADLAFMWKAMEWAKPGGQIALIMNAGFLFKQGSSVPSLRNMLFDTLRITVVINGTELRRTNVMPNTTAPFCIIFAKNQVPEPMAEFRFITPRLEKIINKEGKFRIDTENSVFVSPIIHKECPNILKILSKGSTLDYNTYSKMKSMNLPTLKSMWENTNGDFDPKLKLHSGKGFEKGYVKNTDIKKESSVNFEIFKNISALPNNYVEPILVDSQRLFNIELETIRNKRRVEIYQGPILLVHQSPPIESMRFKALVSKGNLLYNNSYYGYSAKGHPNGFQLVKYLCLILSSNIAIWQALMTCGIFGVERNVIEKIELDNIMVPDFKMLSKSQLAKVEKYFQQLNLSQLNHSELDEWVATLYKLNDWDYQVIVDTLNYRLPYSTIGKNASKESSDIDIENFCKVLRTELQLDPCFDDFKVNVKQFNHITIPPWKCINIEFCKETSNKRTKLNERVIKQFIKTANNTSINPFLVPYNNNNFLVGILTQQQFWSNSQARLLSMKIAEFDNNEVI